MSGEHHGPDVAWRARYAAALATLDSPERMAEFARQVAQVEGGENAALVVVGVERLQQARRVGLLAGSYNPLTLAHVALAEAARHAARLDVVAWAFTAITVDKERVTRASLPARLAQLAAYIAATDPARQTNVGGSDRPDGKHGAGAEGAPNDAQGAASDGRSVNAGDALVILGHGLYVEQAQAMRGLLALDAELFIVVGFDKIVQIFDPRYYADREAALRALFAQARLLVAPRAGQGEADLQELLARPENRPYASHVAYCPLDAAYATDSSTEAREIAARLTPDAIAASSALRRLLPPEGVALAATGAYV